MALKKMESLNVPNGLLFSSFSLIKIVRI